MKKFKEIIYFTTDFLITGFFIYALCLILFIINISFVSSVFASCSENTYCPSLNEFQNQCINAGNYIRVSTSTISAGCESGSSHEDALGCDGINECAVVGSTSCSYDRYYPCPYTWSEECESVNYTVVLECLHTNEAPGGGCSINCGCDYLDSVNCSCISNSCYSPWFMNSSCACECGVSCTSPWVVANNQNCECVCGHDNADFYRYQYDLSVGFNAHWNDVLCCSATTTYPPYCHCVEGIDYIININDSFGLIWNAWELDPLESGTLQQSTASINFQIVYSWEPWQQGGYVNPVVCGELWTYIALVPSDPGYDPECPWCGNPGVKIKDVCGDSLSMVGLEKGQYILIYNNVPSDCSGFIPVLYSWSFYYSPSSSSLGYGISHFTNYIKRGSKSVGHGGNEKRDNP